MISFNFSKFHECLEEFQTSMTMNPGDRGGGSTQRLNGGILAVGVDFRNPKPSRTIKKHNYCTLVAVYWIFHTPPESKNLAEETP